MAINEYEDNGKRLFKVTVSRRSAIKPSIRVQRLRDGIETKRDAERIEKKLIELVSREVQEKENQSSSWALLLKEWELAMRDGRGTRRPVVGTTIHDYTRVLDQYASHWKPIPIEKISRRDVLDALDRMDLEGLSRSRRRTFLMAVNGLYRWAEMEGRLKPGIISPALGIRLGKQEDKDPLILSLSEVRVLLQQAKLRGHSWYSVWATALLTGARSGELMALCWSDVSFERNQIVISKSYSARMKSVKTTKAAYSRIVPMNADLVSLLRSLKAEAPAREEVFPRLSEWRRGEAAKVLRAFCFEIGISPVTFHTLRACFATHLLNGGTAPTVVMRICGWRDLKTMQKYIRLAGIEIRGATEGLKIVPPEDAMPKVIDFYAHQG